MRHAMNVRKGLGLAVACLVGGLLVLALVLGLRTPARAEVAVPAASPGDVVINEVEYDPVQSGTDTAYEWLELFNTTSQPITLAGWTIEDNSSSDVLPEVVLPPQGFAVVAASESFSVNYPAFSGTIVYLGGSIGNGLSNGGDRLVLYDESLNVIDALSYEGDTTIFDCTGFPCGSDLPPGQSLERDPAGVDTDSPADFVVRAAPTPGAGNLPQQGVADLAVDKSGPASVLPGAPITYHITVGNAGTAVATGSLLTDLLPAAVDFTAQLSSFPFTRTGRLLLWQLGDVPTATYHAITVTGRVTGTALGTLANHVTATTTASETATGNNFASWATLVVVHYDPLDVVINEVAWMGTDADSTHEWIELYNPTQAAILLQDWTLSDSGGTLAVLTGTIGAEGYYLLASDAATFSGTVPAIDRLFTGNLRNAGEVLTLTAPGGETIDTANVARGYDNGWAAGDSAIPRHTMERIDPTAPDVEVNWCTNDGVTRNGHDAVGNPINGTPGARSSCYAIPGLTLAKTGPLFVTPGFPLTTFLAVSNTGGLTVTGVVVTDVLPGGVSFVTQTSPFPFSQPASDTLRWEVGDLSPGARSTITLALHAGAALSGTLTNVATATEQAGRVVSATWHAPVLPYVRLYALEPANYDGSGESAALINLGPYAASLAGWSLNDDPSPGGVSFPLTATLDPGEIVWLAEDGDGFYPVWGFDAGWAAQAITRPVSHLVGDWPGFTDGGEAAYLLSDGEQVVDVLAYGSGTASTGWDGPPVPYPYAGYGPGQVLYRKLDQATGLPVPDSDVAADWAQDPDDPIDGRKLRYPGWDVESFFFPAVVTPTAPVTLTIAPDGAFDLLSTTLAAAGESILIEGYTFESFELYHVISDRLQAGVSVTLLLEGGPAGWVEEDRKLELWIAERIHQHPNGAVFFLYGDETRYRYQHAKFAVVDGRVALVSTENFNPRAMPSDDKGNGTLGHRGFVVAVGSAELASHLEAIFARDLDPAHHTDLVPYGTAPFLLDDPLFHPLPEPDWTTYTAVFSTPVETTGSDFTVVQAPENGLRDRDGLLGLLERAGAGDHVSAMQLNEPFTWTVSIGLAGRNPRVEALLGAARRGAEVRLLLDDYYEDGDNSDTCRLLNAIATRESLSLTCRLANVTGLGLHAKSFAVSVGEERWVHVGSLNGTENANKNNRELALQFRSPAAYAHMLAVFEHDWAQGHGPYDYRLRLPLVLADYVGPVDYPLVSEVFVNPPGDDTGGEWIEIYNPGPTTSLAGWRVGDALNVGDYGDGRYTFPAGAQLLHGQVIVVAACASNFSVVYGFNPDYEWTDCDATVPDLAPVGAWDGFGLAVGNTSDEILLHDAGGGLVDSVAWGGAARAGVIPFVDFEPPFPTGGSLKRYPPGNDRDDCTRDFYVSYSPSPGQVAGP